MKLSAKSRYATRILLELAKNEEDLPLSATIISHKTGVTVQFVEQILKPLRQQGFTKSIRGAAGGHMLARPASEITLDQIISLMEGGLALAVCLTEETTCEREDGCPTRKAWGKISQTLEDELSRISLVALLDSDLNFNECL